MATRRRSPDSPRRSQSAPAAGKSSALIGAPKCPKGLDKAGKKKWKELVKLGLALGVLTKADGEMLALYCAAISRWGEAEAKLKQFGLVLNSKKGGVYLNPFLFVLNEASKEMQRLARILGFTGPRKQQIEPNAAIEGHANMTEAEKTEALNALAATLSAHEAANDRGQGEADAAAAAADADAGAAPGAAGPTCGS